MPVACNRIGIDLGSAVLSLAAIRAAGAPPHGRPHRSTPSLRLMFASALVVAREGVDLGKADEGVDLGKADLPSAVPAAVASTPPAPDLGDFRPLRSVSLKRRRSAAPVMDSSPTWSLVLVRALASGRMRGRSSPTLLRGQLAKLTMVGRRSGSIVGRANGVAWPTSSCASR